MKEKIKEFSKKYLIGFILGLITTLSISVIAATYFPSNQTTYDNSVSGLQSTNVQDAIDELYGACFPPNAADTIIDLLPNNPDELYKDDRGNIRYYGKNPNNYVSFNNELWRIIGVIDGKIKIIRIASIGNRAWDSSNNNWARPASLNTYLNNSYYNSINETYRNMISKETYYLGGPSYNNYYSLTASGWYDIERSNSAYSGNSVTIEQYIGLMYISDYGYAAGESCLSERVTSYGDGGVDGCDEIDYLAGLNEWTLVHSSSYSDYVYYLNYSGYVNSASAFITPYGVRPTLYLSSEVQITGGTGTQSDPYKISL